jgi:GTPase
VERTSLLVHLVDAAPGEGRDPVEDYRTIRRELEAFAPELAAKREIVALNKIDLVPREDLDQVRRQFASRIGVPAASVRLVSGATGAGCGELVEAAWAWVHREAPSARR